MMLPITSGLGNENSSETQQKLVQQKVFDTFSMKIYQLFNIEEPRPKPIGKSQSKFDVKQPSWVQYNKILYILSFIST